MKTKPSISADYNRVKRQLDRLNELKRATQAVSSPQFKELFDIANQFASSPNELFSETGEKMKSVLSGTPAPSVSQETTLLDKMISETMAELEEIKASKEFFSEVKILNYPQYANPENDEERRVTMLKMVYKTHMNYPYVLTVGNGWGIPLITKLKGVVIKEGTTRFVDTVNICLDEKGLFPMLKRTELFLQAMTTHGLTKCFDTVTNPVLSYAINEENREKPGSLVKKQVNQDLLFLKRPLFADHYLFKQVKEVAKMEQTERPKPKRLDIFLADLPRQGGSAQYGYRPVIIVRNGLFRRGNMG